MKRVALLLSILSLAAAPAQAQWSTATLSAPRAFMGAATVGNYALFAGGANNNTGGSSDRVDIYDQVSGIWSTATLTQTRRWVAATAVGQYALFAGGGLQGGGDSAVVDVFDSQTMTWSTATLSQARKLIAATSVGTKALFAGGAIGPLFNNPTRSDRVDIYDSALGAPSNPAAWSTATLSQARFFMAATTAGNKAIFGGGTDYLPVGGSVYDRVDIYDDSTGTWSTASLSRARAQLGAASVGTKAYFGGGLDSATTFSGVVDVFDAQTCTWSTAAPLSQPRTEVAAASLGNQVLFVGGIMDPVTGATSAVVDLLNTGTGQWDSTFLLSQARYGLSATTVGGRIMFAGGVPAVQSPTGSAVVDIYEPVGLNYCAATANSTGNAATISATGSASVAANNLVLAASSLPQSSFGFFLTSLTQGFVANPGGSQGNLCLGGSIGRYVGPGQVQNSGAAGMISLAVNLTQHPTPTGLVSVQAGETWNFTAWYRDSVGGSAVSNLSDGYQITFN